MRRGQRGATYETPHYARYYRRVPGIARVAPREEASGDGATSVPNRREPSGDSRSRRLYGRYEGIPRCMPLESLHRVEPHRPTTAGGESAPTLRAARQYNCDATAAGSSACTCAADYRHAPIASRAACRTAAARGNGRRTSIRESPPGGIHACTGQCVFPCDAARRYHQPRHARQSFRKLHAEIRHLKTAWSFSRGAQCVIILALGAWPVQALSCRRDKSATEYDTSGNRFLGTAG